jgi:hypothetical protein
VACKPCRDSAARCAWDAAVKIARRPEDWAQIEGPI